MKKFLSILADLVLGTCVLLLLAVFLAPAFFNLSFNTILSGSMEPVLKTGAMIAMSKVAPEEIKV